MKKLYYLLAASALMMPSLSSAAGKELYLVGSFNNWVTPDQWDQPEYAADKQFVLSDEDDDGTFTGDFEIAEGVINFKVFTEKCDWSDRANVYGMSRGFGSMTDLFSNISYSEELVTDDNQGFGGSYNVEINNWKGGSLHFEVTRNADGMNLKLSGGENQPKVSLYPEIYLIGEFNNWAVPNGDELNGAVPMTPNAEKPTIFSVNKDVAAGNSKYAFCVPATPVSKKSFKIYAPQDMPGFNLYNNPEGEAAKLVINNLKGYSKTADYPKLNLLDWAGGDVTFSFNTAYSSCEIYSEDAPKLQEQDFYAVLKVDGNSVGVVPMMTLTNGLFISTLAMGCDCKDLEMTFTTERSENPSADSIWGIEPSKVYDGHSNNDVVRFVKGGSPYIVHLTRSGYASIKIDLNFGIADIYSSCPVYPADAEELYLDGYQVGWTSPVEANADMLIKFEKVEYGIFESWVDCPYREPEYNESTMQFRFFTKLAGWTSEFSLGSEMDDFRVIEADMESGTYTSDIYQYGLSNWGLANWPGGRLWMQVNLLNMKLTISTESAVKEIEEATEGEVSYYNLQGVKVSEPGAGLYIKVTDGKGSEKVLIK